MLNFWQCSLFRARLEPIVDRELRKGRTVELGVDPSGTADTPVQRAFRQAATSSGVRLPHGPLYSSTDNLISGRVASDLKDTEIHASVILELYDNLQNCRISDRPALLAQWFAAMSLFPERLFDTMHSELGALGVMRPSNSLSKPGPDLPPEVEQFMVEDLLRGGAIARVVNARESSRRREGLVSAQITYLMYQQLHRERTGAWIETLDEFLEEVKAVDTRLMRGTVTVDQLPFDGFMATTWSGRAGCADDFTKILELSCLRSGIAIDLGGGLGFVLNGLANEMAARKRPFRDTFLVDFRRPSELGSSPYLRKYVGQNLVRWKPTEQDMQDVAEAITYRRFGDDLRYGNLVGWWPQILEAVEAPGPPPYLLYLLLNVLPIGIRRQVGASSNGFTTLRAQPVRRGRAFCMCKMD